MKLSVVIPAYNEEQSLPETLNNIYDKLRDEKVPHEILVVNDNSNDGTIDVLEQFSETIPTLVFHTNHGPNGFGNAIRFGLTRTSGDCIALMMADLSDSPEDLVTFYRKMVRGNYDCVFGSRFIKGGSTSHYPKHKLLLNRLVNNAVRVMFGIPYNDFTNAFKMYKKETIEGISPLLSPHFNITLEMPLKAIIRGYTFAIVPNTWRGRKYGTSNLKIKEMGSRYFYIFLYCLIEKFFSRGDFNKKN